MTKNLLAKTIIFFLFSKMAWASQVPVLASFSQLTQATKENKMTYLTQVVKIIQKEKMFFLNPILASGKYSNRFCVAGLYGSNRVLKNIDAIPYYSCQQDINSAALYFGDLRNSSDWQHFVQLVGLMCMQNKKNKCQSLRNIQIDDQLPF